MSEAMKLPRVEQEAQQHPALANLLQLPTGDLLSAAAQVLMDAEGLEPDPTEEGRGTLFGYLPIADNAHASEWLEIRVTRASVSAIYQASYRPPMSQIASPATRWGIRDREGDLRYWSQGIHGGNEVTLALGGSPGIPVEDESVNALIMRWYLSVGIYRALAPEAAAELAVSAIPPHVARYENQSPEGIVVPRRIIMHGIEVSS